MQSLASYGRLAATAASGTMAFGIDGSSTLTGALRTPVRYADVLTGVPGATISNEETRFTLGRFHWLLTAGSAPDSWDLVTWLFSPDPTNTLLALESNALAIRSILTQRAAAMAFAFDYDCPVFDNNGFCLTVGARYGQLGSDINEFAGLVTAAFRLSPEVRIGAFLDQVGGGAVPDGLRMQSRAPLFGGFIVYEQNRDFIGVRLRASVAYQEGKVRVTRRELADTEPGQGTGDLRSFGFAFEASYGFALGQGWAVAPYGGIRRVESSRDSYTESASDTVQFPIAYETFGQYVTSATAGLRVRGALTDRLALVVGAGIEYDLSARMDRYSGTSEIIGVERFDIDVSRDANALRGVGAVGLRYAVAANQHLMLDAGVRQTPYGNDPSVNSMIRYSIGF